MVHSRADQGERVGFGPTLADAPGLKATDLDHSVTTCGLRFVTEATEGGKGKQVILSTVKLFAKVAKG